MWRQRCLEMDDEPPGEIQTAKELNYFIRSTNYPSRCLGRVFVGERSLQVSTPNHSNPGNPYIRRRDGVGVGTGTDG